MRQTCTFIEELHVSHARSLGREFLAQPHSSVRTQSNPCQAHTFNSLFSMVSTLLLDGFPLLRMCMSSCLLLRADIYLPHPPAIGGGLGPHR